MLLNSGDGTFGPEQIYGTGPSSLSLTAADFDHDGDIDIITADYRDNRLSVLLNRAR